jgi:hypothetical protein
MYSFELIKNKRGNMPKKKVSTECSQASKKKGRPKKVNDSITPKRRGRPPKPRKYEKEEIDTSEVKTLKVLGYCTNTECTCAITDADLEEGKKTICICVRCGLRQRIGQLLKEASKIMKPKSKKAFLNDIPNVHEDHEAYHHEVNVPEEFKSFSINSGDDWDS